MARQWTTKTQVSGYKFLLSRMQHALIRHDPKMVHDPMKSQSRALLVGTLCAVLFAGACGALALFRPQGSVGEASIFVAKEDGAIYVKLDDKLYPTLNLASARLIVGKPEAPRNVSISKLNNFSRGPLLGIPGAPADIQNRLLSYTSWVSCDTSNEYGDISDQIVIGGDIPLGNVNGLTENTAVYAVNNNDYYLIYKGSRAKINNYDKAIAQVLGLEGATPKPISDSILNTIPQVEDIDIPDVPNLGKKSKLNLPSMPNTVGTIFQTIWQNKPNYYILLENSIQIIPETVAKILSLQYQSLNTDIPTVLEKYLTEVPQTNDVQISQFPEVPPQLITKAISPVFCSKYTSIENKTQVEVLVGKNLSEEINNKAIKLVSADGSGSNLDRFIVPAGTAAYIEATTSAAKEDIGFNKYYLSDLGIKYQLGSEKDTEYLGLSDENQTVPNALLKLFPEGPTLSRTEALVSHDVVQADASAVPIPDPAANESS